MGPPRHRIGGAIVMSSGMVLASGCSVADQILETIEFAVRAVDIWV